MNRKEKYLLLKGCAGLGNRLYTLTNAVAYCVRNSRVLYVDWRDGQFDVDQVNAFYKHFELHDMPHIQDIEILMSDAIKSTYPKEIPGLLSKGIYKTYEMDSSHRLKKLPSGLIPRGKPSMIYGYWRRRDTEGKVGPTSDRHTLAAMMSQDEFELGQFLSDNRDEDLVIFADFCPPFDFKFFNAHVRLRPSLKHEIEAFAQANGLSDAVGIHIRNTDKKPVTSFQRIKDALTDFDFKSIFLATDDKNLEEEIVKWGYPVRSQAKFMPEGEMKGLHFWGLHNKRDDVKESMFKESIIDMWALAECKYLLYQGNSSFSCFADNLRDNQQSFDWQTL